MHDATLAPLRPTPDSAAPPPSPEGELERALLESRQRWRELVGLAADLVFETDAAGRLTFLWPERVLGWTAAGLLGQVPERLLAEAGGPDACNPFRPQAPVRRRRAWLRRADGGTTCLMFAAAPLLDSEGRIVGARGIGQDVSEQDGYDAAMAAALRRGEVIDHIMWRMRQEVLAPRMMEAVLDSLVAALGAEGGTVIEFSRLGGDPAGAAEREHGVGAEAIGPTAWALLDQATETGAGQPRDGVAPDGRRVLVCPCQTRFGTRAGLALWREAGGRAWDAEDLVLAGSATGIVRVILEHDNIQREMARQARTDPLTGLLNRRAFLDEMARRMERLDRDDVPGTLMFVDLDHFKALNDACGHEAGDEALCLTAEMLRGACRAGDLVARLGGDEFAVWLDGTDDLAAAERAEALRLEAPGALGTPGEALGIVLSMSVGIATRWPGRDDSIEALIGRADAAMYEVKRAGRGHWRVAHGEA